MRFKADESAQAITGPYRKLHPDDNNERQSIHAHVSVPLPVLITPGSMKTRNQYAEHSSAKPISGGSK